ncbi:MAG: anti-sigma F factor, partial [Bacillota bacterium]|nr:anti-sigma F factor [Bacillota bacterium]
MNEKEKIEAWQRLFRNAENRLTMTFQAVDGNVSVARLTTASFGSSLGFSMAELEEIKVAISEGVSNAMIHGYLENSEKSVVMSLAQSQGELLVMIRDNGVGMDDVLRSMEPAYSTTEERMGMGFVFMQSFMDELTVLSSPGCGTTLLMRKKPQR